MKIAVLFHAQHSPKKLKNYVVWHLANTWREDGHEVIFLFGARAYVPADLILVHIGLSVVPDEYLKFAKRYPIALNSHVRDIRKSAFSANLLTENDDYDGPVIVKSDFNFRGRSEHALYRYNLKWQWSQWKLKLLFPLPRAMASQGFLLYKNMADVPQSFFVHPHYVVEKFYPEKENDLYHIRHLQFLGDCLHCLRLSAREPIVKGEIAIDIKPIEPHPDILAMREQMKLDYGKLDYVVCNGKAILIDVNKTMGVGYAPGPQTDEMRRQRARGLYSYWEQ